MPVQYYVNLNYVCNERCIFCASDYTNNLRIGGRAPSVTLADVRAWTGDAAPKAGDRVLLAGGEPTLHKELLPIVRYLGRECRDVVLFSNGLRLADPAFAASVVEAGVTRFEIALFGATAERHEAITRVPGSFERTLAALNTLTALRRGRDFVVEVRLLVSRQSSPDNPDIVRLVRERARDIDAFSLNRLILSDNAGRVDASISWEEARQSINESARLVRSYGYELVFTPMPLCIFDDDNAAFVRREIDARRARIAAGLQPAAWDFRYLDPVVASGGATDARSTARAALPSPCLHCDYIFDCGRVEGWYVRRHGLAGLRTVHPAGPAPALAGEAAR
jgi:MoaA/NifB/PqqE/SkfB family radical SAM enzyme